MIEVALAYMRGRTLDNAFIILDEAQNTTPAQMKMFHAHWFWVKSDYNRRPDTEGSSGIGQIRTGDRSSCSEKSG